MDHLTDEIMMKYIGVLIHFLLLLPGYVIFALMSLTLTVFDNQVYNDIQLN